MNWYLATAKHESNFEIEIKIIKDYNAWFWEYVSSISQNNLKTTLENKTIPGPF